MTSVTRYKCDICGTEYNSEDVCAECEAEHVLPDGISPTYVYYPKSYGNDAVYPHSVTVTFEDGTKYTYKR